MRNEEKRQNLVWDQDVAGSNPVAPTIFPKRELAAGSQAAALTGSQSRDALAALERLEAFRQATGKRVSLLAGISAYCEAATKLNDVALSEAIEGYLSTVASVKRKDVLEAVEEFIESRKHKTEAKDGKRPQLSAGDAYNVAMWLREFARTFPNTAVCDLSKEHLKAGYEAVKRAKQLKFESP